MHNYEPPKGKVKGLGAGVSAETLTCQAIGSLRLSVVSWEKCILSFSSSGCGCNASLACLGRQHSLLGQMPDSVPHLLWWS